MAYLTKTRFKEAMECPDKLYYYRREGYADNRLDNEFFQELAKSGIQVGELAKCYYPEGIEVVERDSEKAVVHTAELLKREKVTIFEAAISVENLLVRVDVLIKDGQQIELIEVKSKSIFDEREIFTRTQSIHSEWKEYVYDIAFQVFVAQQALKGSTIKGYLSLINKNSICTIDGLYQKFRLRKNGSQYVVVTSPAMPFGEPLLKTVDLTAAIQKIIEGQETINGKPYSFNDYVRILSAAVLTDQMLMSGTGRHCKSCTYKTTADDKLKGLKSGYENCWQKKNGFKEEQFLSPSVFDIWRLHHSKLDQFLAEKRYFLNQISKDDLRPRGKVKLERQLSTADRQWLQIERAIDPKLGPYINKTGLKKELDKLNFPLHFIDFEVAMNAIPFLKGLQPYHRLAFQFSHHIFEKGGKISHAGQWIETRLGVNPNMEFLRKLKQELSKDNGSILIYSSYENTILLHLLDVINVSNEGDKDEIAQFVKTITWCEEEGKEGWIGDRAMTDMRQWVLDFYISPHMKNSNSLKIVLPAILNESQFLKSKYEKNIYGSDEIPSHNFREQRWIHYGEDQLVKNPYGFLPPVFDGLDRLAIEFLFEEDELADGGAAMCAYNLMQFTEMKDAERSAIIEALYKYCELDTLAMVMLYEGLNDLIA